MFFQEFEIVEMPSVEIQGEPCERVGCERRIGERHWMSRQDVDSFYCSLECADRDLEAYKMCAIWNKLNQQGTQVAPLEEQPPVRYAGAVWHRVWAGTDYPFTGDEWWDGVLECRDGQEPMLHDLFDLGNAQVKAVHDEMFR